MTVSLNLEKCFLVILPKCSLWIKYNTDWFKGREDMLRRSGSGTLIIIMRHAKEIKNIIIPELFYGRLNENLQKDDIIRQKAAFTLFVIAEQHG